MVITSTLETLPTHIVTSPLASLRLFRSFCFELPILATEPVSNTQLLLGVLVRYTSITHISNILLLKLPAFLSTKYLRQFRYQWPFPLIEALRLGFGFLGFFTGAATGLPFMKFPFWPLPFFETSGLVNHQHLMLLLDFYFRGLKHREQLWDHLHPLHVIIHQEALVAWW